MKIKDLTEKIENLRIDHILVVEEMKENLEETVKERTMDLELQAIELEDLMEKIYYQKKAREDQLNSLDNRISELTKYRDSLSAEIKALSPTKKTEEAECDV